MFSCGNISRRSYKLRQSVQANWLAFVLKCYTLYTGYQNQFRIDQGSIFRSYKWKQIADLNGVILRLFRATADHCLGIVECYHELWEGSIAKYSSVIQLFIHHIFYAFMLKPWMRLWGKWACEILYNIWSYFYIPNCKYWSL